LFFLKNNWGFQPDPNLSNRRPKDGFTGADHHNVTTAFYKPGTCIQMMCDGSVGKAGPSLLAYLQVGTQNAAVAIAAKSVCVPDSATVWYQVTNDPDSNIALPTDRLAIALGAIADAAYGWFWVGGVCPEQFVTALAGNYKTDGNVAAGIITGHDLSVDEIGLGPALGVATGAAKEGDAGFALAADA